DTLEAVRGEIVALDEAAAEFIAAASPAYKASARNLVHYVGLRRRDVRSLQDELARLGLSSLGRAESHVLTNLDDVLGPLRPSAQGRGDILTRPPAHSGPELRGRAGAVGDAHGGPARPRANRAPCPHYGHHAGGGGRQSHTDPRPRARRDGLPAN